MRKNFIGQITFLLILLAISILSVRAQSYESTITGRVIDEYGKPVAEASVYSNYAQVGRCSNSTTKSDKNGYFKMLEYCNLIERKLYLHILSSEPTDALTLIEPPSEALNSENSNYTEIPVILKENNNIDLGDVRVQVWYGTIELFITNENGKPFYKNDDDWAKMILILRKINGEFVGDQTLSISDTEESVNMEKGSIRLSLPEGEWEIELIPDWKDIDYDTGLTKNSLGRVKIVTNRSKPLSPFKICINR